jgi:4-hydroxybenzoate polyprenyltransferase
MTVPRRNGDRSHAWLQLLRPANVVTAAADVLAGVAVAGHAPAATLACLLPATMFLYAGGVVLNDYFDRHLDAVERPERPLPSGNISATAAGNFGLALLLAGVGLAALAGQTTGLLAAALALAIVLYDAGAKRHALAGPLTMGLCRALNLLLGVAVLPATLATAWPLALLPLVYIASVTLVSRGEVHGSARHVAATASVLVAGVVAALGLLAIRPGSVWPLALGLTAAFGWRVLPAFGRAVRSPDPATLGTAVRTGVLSLVLANAVVAAAYAGIIECLAILLTGLVATRLARLFAVT